MITPTATLFLTAALSALSASLSTAAPNTYTYYDGVDMFTGGNILQASGLTNPSSGQSQLQCQIACNNQVSCTGYVWDSRVSVCALMSQMGNPDAQESTYLSAVKVQASVSVSGDRYPGYSKLPQMDVLVNTTSFKDVAFSDCPYYCNQTISCFGYTTINGRGRGCILLLGDIKGKEFSNPGSDIFTRIEQKVPVPTINYYAETSISRISTSMIIDSAATTLSACGKSCSIDTACDGFFFKSTTSTCTKHTGGFSNQMISDSKVVTYIKGVMINSPSWTNYPSSYEYAIEAGYQRAATSILVVDADTRKCGKTCSQNPACAGFMMDKSKENSCYIIKKFDPISITENPNFDTYIKKFSTFV